MKQVIVLFLFFQMLTIPAFAQQYKYHIVEQGETTAAIARKYNISEATLFQYNPDARSGISPNTKLVVPLTETVRQEPQGTQKFRTHRVKRKETLFSLSQQYDVSIGDIKKYNKHLYSEELQRGETIRIPLKTEQEREPEPSVSNPMDLTAKEHVVLPKEGWFRISQRYNVTIEDLKSLNPQITELQPGMVLKVRNGDLEQVVEVDGDLFKYYLVEPKDTIFGLTRRFGISQDSLLTLNPALADGLNTGMVLRIPNLEFPEAGEYTEGSIVNLERKITNYDTKNLVVMLPFNLEKIVVTDTSSNSAERLRKDEVMQISLDFYSGVLMAVDSAKALGISINMTVYDTQKNAGKVYSIVAANDFSNVDAVIGPLLQSTAEAAASALQKRDIPVISPVTKKQTGSMQNFLQARPADEMLTSSMISYISGNVTGKNLIIIADVPSANKKRELMAVFPNARIVNPREENTVNRNELTAALATGRPNWVILESEKIGVLSSTTSYLNSLRETYDITLLTTNRNKSFESDNISNRHLANLNFHYPSVDRVYSLEKNGGFIEKYMNKYGVVPNTYAVRGFDVTYDVLLRLASAENIYASLGEAGVTQYVENKFEYEKRPMGGYQNRAVYILAYDKDMNLNVMR